MSSTLLGYLVSVALIVILFYRYAARLIRGGHTISPRPPGPSGYPLIGHLQPAAHPAYKTVARWSDEYHSDMIMYKILGHDTIFLNSYEAATDLLDDRSAIYSDRYIPGLVMLRELCGLGWIFAFQRYGREWRDGRKAFHQEYNAEAIIQYRPSALTATHKLLHRLLSTPDEFVAHMHHLAGERILYAAYGIEPKGEDDPWIAMSEHITAIADATLQLGRYWVDFIPILRYVPPWMPGAGFQRQARLWRRMATETREKPFDYVKQRLNEGQEVPDCAAKSLIERNIDDSKDPEYWEMIVKGALGSMYGAGTDTVAGALVSFILAMAQYPEIQRKAQGFIDQVCPGRLPNFSDRESLPYLEAVLMENLRWNPVATFTPTHRCTQDDVYRGYHIPEGTVFIANIWAILHDSETYPDPERFHPERFLTADEREISMNVLDPSNAAFGFGRRVCPGQYMARDTLWLAIASILAVFDISDAVDENGVPVPRGAENAGGFITLPKPFSCRIRPRTAAHAELVNDTVLAG